MNSGGAEKNTTQTPPVQGVAPEKPNVAGSAGKAENGGCKCGANCTCNPCTCK